MGLTAGIVGLPNVGKSTLFNAITNSQVEAANYPFATIQPNVGTVEVFDPRLIHLTNLFKSEKTVYATFEFTDIAGLVKGASKGEGRGNQFLTNIREVDAICHVVRCFDNAEVIHVEESVDPIRDAEIINLELVMADLETVEKRILRVEKKALTTKDKESVQEYEALKLIKAALEEGKPARSVSLNETQEVVVKSFNLLTKKPTIFVANVGEEHIADPEGNPYYAKLKEFAKSEGSEIVHICAKVEEEISLLEQEDREMFLESYGIKESGLERVTKAAFKLLGLETYFTAGPKESKAWTFKTGMKAPQCAGIIHSDFERGFIKAEIYSYDDLIKFGTEQGVKENGRFRIEGKEYVVKDGDIVHFRFNV